MTVFPSLKPSRVLDMNAQDVLEQFVKNRTFSCCQRQIFVALVYQGIAICGNSARSEISNLIRIFMTGKSATQSAENKEIRSARKYK